MGKLDCYTDKEGYCFTHNYDFISLQDLLEYTILPLLIDLEEDADGDLFWEWVVAVHN